MTVCSGRQVPRAEPLPALLDALDVVERPVGVVPVLDQVAPGEEPALGVLVVVEHGDRHVPLAHVAVDDADLAVLDAVARRELAPHEGQEPAQRVVVLVVGEAEHGPGLVGP